MGLVDANLVCDGLKKKEFFARSLLWVYEGIGYPFDLRWDEGKRDIR